MSSPIGPSNNPLNTNAQAAQSTGNTQPSSSNSSITAIFGRVMGLLTPKSSSNPSSNLSSIKNPPKAPSYQEVCRSFPQITTTVYRVSEPQAQAVKKEIGAVKSKLEGAIAHRKEIEQAEKRENAEKSGKIFVEGFVKLLREELPKLKLLPAKLNQELDILKQACQGNDPVKLKEGIDELEGTMNSIIYGYSAEESFLALQGEASNFNSSVAKLSGEYQAAQEGRSGPLTEKALEQVKNMEAQLQLLEIHDRVNEMQLPRLPLETVLDPNKKLKREISWMDSGDKMRRDAEIKAGSKRIGSSFVSVVPALTEGNEMQHMLYIQSAVDSKEDGRPVYSRVNLSTGGTKHAELSTILQEIDSLYRQKS